MKISLWYSITDGPWGGANSFIKALSNQLIEKGCEVFFEPKPSSDIILINSWMYGPGKFLTPKMVKGVRKYGTQHFLNKILFLLGRRGKTPPIIHRLDGIAALYGRADNSDEIQIKINKMTDFTIFQSEFCRKSFASYGVCPQKSMVIHNGVDDKVYYPDRSERKPTKTLKALAVSWSNNPKKGFSTLVEIAAISDIEVTFIGNWCNSIPQRNVKVIGTKTSSEIAEIMRESDILIHPAENDPCPNVVLEALASGLPVLYRDSGGTAELSKGYGVPIRANDLKGSLNEIRERYSELREKILANRYQFSIKRAAEQYLKVFEESRAKTA